MTDEADASGDEATVDGHTGVLEYRLDGDRLELVHTEVPDELEGRGVGSRAVEGHGGRELGRARVEYPPGHAATEAEADHAEL